jgi:hypothetical protein
MFDRVVDQQNQPIKYGNNWIKFFPIVANFLPNIILFFHYKLFFYYHHLLSVHIQYLYMNNIEAHHFPMIGEYKIPVRIQIELTNATLYQCTSNKSLFHLPVLTGTMTNYSIVNVSLLERISIDHA